MTKHSEKELNHQLRDIQKELEQAKAIITKLDMIVQRLYDGRFKKMSDTYEAEQKQLLERKAELQAFIDESKEQNLNVTHSFKWYASTQILLN